jgi:hypothetical protein
MTAFRRRNTDGLDVADEGARQTEDQKPGGLTVSAGDEDLSRWILDCAQAGRLRAAKA